MSAPDKENTPILPPWDLFAHGTPEDIDPRDEPGFGRTTLYTLVDLFAQEENHGS